MRAPATASARVDETVKAKADRYFADQCRRLGPIDDAPAQARPLRRPGQRLASNLDHLSQAQLRPA